MATEKAVLGFPQAVLLAEIHRGTVEGPALFEYARGLGLFSERNGFYQALDRLEKRGLVVVTPKKNGVTVNHYRAAPGSVEVLGWLQSLAKEICRARRS